MNRDIEGDYCTTVLFSIDQRNVWEKNLGKKKKVQEWGENLRKLPYLR